MSLRLPWARRFLGFQPVHIVAEYDGKIVSKSCRKKLRILNTLPNGVRLTHHNTLMILTKIVQKKIADFEHPTLTGNAGAKDNPIASKTLRNRFS